MQSHDDDPEVHDFGWLPEIFGFIITVGLIALFFGLAI